MKKALFVIALIFSVCRISAQNVDKSSPLPDKLEHSIDSIMYLGRILTPDEVNAEVIKMNRSLINYKDWQIASMSLTIFCMGFGVTAAATADKNPTPWIFCAGITGTAALVCSVVSITKLKFDNLYITPQGVVYRF